ncbi:MAG TPA: biotin--[acetyl-CoA-carboxylase] ligase [Candidatus Cloacimonadota bacterium]|nr:biotin--[acetyl-CoA-carboxylase] ligase [Candidatus Cloacimonadota bacterium]
MKVDFSHPFFDECLWYTKLSSTTTQVLSLIKENAVNGNVLVIADQQLNGRGRNNLTWISPTGGIWMTAALYNLNQLNCITLFIGNCIFKALIEMYPEIGESLYLKWPNDIMLGDKKIAGILSENYPSLSYTLIGIGIDTNIDSMPSDIQDFSTSLLIFLHKETDNKALITSIYNYLLNELPLILENHTNSTIQFHNEHSFLKNKKIEINTDFGSYTGYFSHVNYEGAIVLNMPGGIKQPFFSGSVRIIREDGNV